METLNSVIKQAIENHDFQAGTLNALHGATDGHPWANGKSLEQRKNEVLFALVGRIPNDELEKIHTAV